MKYQTLYDLTMDQGGATIRVKDYPEKIVMPKVGYAVGNSADAIILLTPKPEFRNDPDFTQPFDQAVDRVLYYIGHIPLDAEYLGTWVDAGEMYIEPVDVFARKDFALGVAWARGEKAIYDIAKQKDIRIKYA